MLNMKGTDSMDSINFGKVKLPYDEKAERLLLGAIIRTPKILIDFCDTLKPIHFYSNTYAAIYKAFMQLFIAAESIVPKSIINSVLENGVFDTEEEAGNCISELCLSAAGKAKAITCALEIKEAYMLRSLLKISENIISRVKCGLPSGEILDIAENKIIDLIGTH